MKGLIRFGYEKIIDASSPGSWEKYVHADTYTEFLVQSQLYNRNGKYSTLPEMLKNDPPAEKLHFLVSSAAIGYLKQLNNFIPDIRNNNGNLFLPFTSYRFEILQSDISDPRKHIVSIKFISEPLLWHDTVGDLLLVSSRGNRSVNEEFHTEMVRLRPFFSIYSFQKMTDEMQS